MNNGFSQSQIDMLTNPLGEGSIRHHDIDRRKCSDVEGSAAIAAANAVFGYDGWDREIVEIKRLSEHERNGVAYCSYLAFVRVTVRAGEQIVIREGTGFACASAKSTEDVNERAAKEAEIDATIRALATFGGPFGSMLCGCDMAVDPVNEAANDVQRLQTAVSARQVVLAHVQQVRCCSDVRQDGARGRAEKAFVIVSTNGEMWPVTSPEGFCSGLRQLVEGATSVEAVHRIRLANQSGLARLRHVAGLTNSRGEHYSNILARLFSRKESELRARTLSDEDGSATSTNRVGPQSRIACAEALGEKEAGASSPSSVDGESAKGIVSGQGHDCPVEGSIGLDASSQVVEAESAEVERLKPISVAMASTLDVCEADPCKPAPAVSAGQSCETQKLETREGGGASQVLSPGSHAEKESGEDVVGGQAPLIEQVCGSRGAGAAPTRRSQISGGYCVDKSVLAIPSERRLRSKAHLSMVASLPCLVCEETPCHAHHVTFAQPRGLSQKVSDEFTVPLCALHHNALHASGRETSWWRAEGIDPLVHAKRLWLLTADLLSGGAGGETGGASVSSSNLSGQQKA